MKRLPLMIAGVLASAPLYGLGLGDPELRSYLGEPLSLTVPLYLSEGEQRRFAELRARIGDRAMFERMQLDFRPEWQSLQVKLMQQGPAYWLQLSSQGSINEPLVQFPLDLHLGSNRLVRTMTLLLDPRPAPMTLPESAAPSVSPEPSYRAAEPVSPVVAEAPRRTTVATAAIPPQHVPQRRGDQYGPVAVNQTLGDIAQQVRPAGASLYQTLIALWEANPQAFFNNNMNRLMAGSTLEIPGDAAILALDATAAKREVIAQYRQPREPGRPLSAAPVVEPAAASPSTPATPATVSSPAVAATLPAEPTTPAVTESIPSESATVPMVDDEEPKLTLLMPSSLEQIPAAVRDEVQLLGERFRSLNEENTELRERISELERHIDTLSQQMLLLAENTLALSSAEVARLARQEANLDASNDTDTTAQSAAAQPAGSPAAGATDEQPAPLAVTTEVPTVEKSGNSAGVRYAVLAGLLLLGGMVAGVWYRRLRQRERYKDVMHRL